MSHVQALHEALKRHEAQRVKSRVVRSDDDPPPEATDASALHFVHRQVIETEELR